jgi:type II secretory pathway component PulK
MTLKSSKNGVALMLVLVALIFLSLISFEFMYASRVDLKISANARNRLQAWYLAQSASRISLLRLYLYQKVIEMKQNGQPIPVEANVIDQIWYFPLPSFPFPGQVFGKDHRLPGEVSSVIKPEGSLIPINLLDGNKNRSSSKKIAEDILEQCRQLFTSEVENNEEFDKLYRGLRFEDLFDPLVDWIDANNDRKDGGGDESTEYERKDPPYRPRNDRIPVISELHMIQGWNDDLYKRFSPQFSVLKSDLTINPNHIPLIRLKSFHPPLSPEDLKAIDERRRDQPFKDLKDMATYIQTSSDVRNGQGFKFPDKLKSSTTESIFKIEAIGIVGQAKRKLELGIRLSELDDKNKKPGNNPEASASTSETDKSKTTQKEIKFGPPEVVSFEVVL